MNPNDVGFILLIILGSAVALGLAIALIVVSVKVTGGLLKAVGWLIAHVVRFVGGLIKDVIALVGAIIAGLVALPFATFNVVLGRWESAGRWGQALRREGLNIGYRTYSIVLKRPLQLFLLDGVLSGLEGRLPEDATGEATPPLRAERRSGPSEFEGYAIEGTLRPGGSGAKLYIAEPDEETRRRLNITSDRVVIKSFALEEGSSLPQIVRESRALDSARALGLVYDHGLDNGRFWYALAGLILWQDGAAAIAPVTQTLLTALTGTAIYKLLKTRTLRPRPYQVHQAVVLGERPLDHFSFPSGHTLHAVLLTVMLGHFYPALLPLLAPFTALVALSRMVLGLHYPTDVLAGAALGATLAGISLGFC